MEVQKMKDLWTRRTGAKTYSQSWAGGTGGEVFVRGRACAASDGRGASIVWIELYRKTKALVERKNLKWENGPRQFLRFPI